MQMSLSLNGQIGWLVGIGYIIISMLVTIHLDYNCVNRSNFT